MTKTELEVKAREIAADNVRLLGEIEQLQSDLRMKQVEMDTQLERARFIITESFTFLKVDIDKAKVAMKLAAEKWSASKRRVR